MECIFSALKSVETDVLKNLNQFKQRNLPALYHGQQVHKYFSARFPWQRPKNTFERTPKKEKPTPAHRQNGIL